MRGGIKAQGLGQPADLNPGNIDSELARDQNVVLKAVARLVGYPTAMGACTELFAGLSPEVRMEKSGAWGECRFFFFCVGSDRACRMSVIRQVKGVDDFLF